MEKLTFTMELRAEPGVEYHLLTGYAAVFNSPSEDLGGFIEEIAPGAFQDTLGEDIRALWNHNSQYVLARTKNNTLKLAEDQRGLKISIILPSTSYADDLMALVQRGDVNQMSFGFSVLDDAWGQRNGYPLRTLKKVHLYEVSPVTFPAYPETSLEARAKAESIRMEIAITSGDVVKPETLTDGRLWRERELLRLKSYEL